MLWIEPCTIFYSAAMGGLVTGLFMSFTYRNAHRRYTDAIEKLWSEDIYNLKGSCTLAHHKLIELEKKISTKIVDKPVNSSPKYNKNKGYKHTRHISQGA